MVSPFSNVKGNARVIVLSEGAGAITFQWADIYLPLYMLALGASEIQVGLLASVFILTQFISSFVGGYIADRFGRKRVLVVVDIICWAVPFFIYAIANNPWYFLVGRFISGFINMVMPAFQCLFVEDVPVEHRPAVFGMLQFAMQGPACLPRWPACWSGSWASSLPGVSSCSPVLSRTLPYHFGAYLLCMRPA